MKEYYENLKDDDILNLLYGQISILEEYHLINLHNYLQNLPLINSVEKLLLFKKYINFVHNIIINIPQMLQFCPVFVFYNIENVKYFLKDYYKISELYNKKGQMIKIKINKKWYEINN